MDVNVVSVEQPPPVLAILMVVGGLAIFQLADAIDGIAVWSTESSRK